MIIFAFNDFERVLNPNVVSISMTESIIKRPASFLYERSHFLNNPGGVIRVQMVRPALRIGNHLNRRIAHDVPKIVTDKRASIVARCLRRVDDRWTREEKVLQTLAGFD